MTGLAVLLGVAALGSVHPAHAQKTEASAADPATRERSRTAFRKGVAQLRAQDWSGARASFEEAWSLVQHPSILLNLGIARLKTDDPVLAEQDLVRFLSEDAGATQEELTSARDSLAEARGRIGTVRVVTTPANARVAIDGKPIAVRPGEGGLAEARMKAGKHTVVVEADGFISVDRVVELPPKGEAEVKVALLARDAPVATKAVPQGATGPSTRTIVGWSLAGTAGVALVASGVMAVRALSLSSDYETPGSASFQQPDVKDDGVTMRTGADVAFVVALLAGAGAVVLLFTHVGQDSRDGGDPAHPTVTARARPASMPALLRW